MLGLYGKAFAFCFFAMIMIMMMMMMMMIMMIVKNKWVEKIVVRIRTEHIQKFLFFLLVHSG